jgi:glycogen synthase
MKVLMTTDTVGGVWTYAVELARELIRRGVDVVLATMGAPLSQVQRAEVVGLPGVEVHESAYRLEWMAEPWADVAAAGEWLLRLEQQTAPDVVHLNGYAHGYLPWQAPVLIVAHSCVLSWWEAVKGEHAPPEWNRYRAEVTRGLHAADLVIAPTRAMLDALERHYGRIAWTRVVPNGRDVGQFCAGDKEPFILAAGRLWDEAKNIGALNQVAPGLPWPIYVAGEQQHPDGGAACHASLRLLGRLAPWELGGWFSRSTIYALPARYEPFGLSVLEAALSGCALVLGDIPSLHEIWGDTALYVRPGSVHELDAALRRLIDQPALRRDLARRSQRRACSLTTGAMVEAYLDSYTHLASSVPALSRDK